MINDRLHTFTARAAFILLAQGVTLCVMLSACTEPPKVAAGPPAAVGGSPAAMVAEASRLEAEGRLLFARRRGEEALRLAYRALEIRRKVLGDGHADTWRTAELIADIHLQANLLEQAEVALQFDVAARERTLGATSVELARPLGQLAEIAVKRRNYPVAEQLRRRALSLLERGLGPWHPDVATGNVHLAVLLVELCRGSEAQALLQRALEIQGRAAGPTSPELARTLEHLADAQWIANDDTGAESTLQKAIGLLSPHESGRAEGLMHAHSRLARMYGDRNLSKEALAACERVVEISERSPGLSVAARVSSAAQIWPLARTAGSPAAADKLVARLAVAHIERARPGAAAPTPAPNRCRPPPSTPSTGGSVSNAGAVVSGLAGGFRRCYNLALKKDPAVSGSLRITARLGASGEVVNADTFAPVGPMVEVGECVVDVVFLQSQFAAPAGGGATIVIPVTFVVQ